MIRNLIGLLVLVLLIIWGMGWYHLDSTKTIKGIPLTLSHWEDTTAHATLGQVMHTKAFKISPRQRHNFGYTESIHWFKFKLKSQQIPQELSLEIKNHLINRLELFEVKNNKITSLGRSGDAFLFSQRPTPSRTFVYPISLNPYDEASYYLKLDKRYENLATEITLWQTNDFEDRDQREYLLWGIFIGVVLFIVILNIIFWNTTHDTVYLWYSAYIVGLTLRQLADSGLGFQYLWAQLPELNYPDAIIQALWLYVPAQIQFQQQFLGFRQNSPLIYKISQLLKYTFLICSLVLLLFQISGIIYQFTAAPLFISRLHALISTSTLIIFIWIAFQQVQSNDSLKKMYGLGLCLQMSGQIIIVLQNLLRNKINGLFLIDSYFILFFVFFIDLVLFAYLLAYRYRQSLNQNQQLQLNLIQTQQATNQKIIAVLESERQQINEILRNEVGQRLQASQNTLAGSDPSIILNDALQLISNAHEDLSRIVENRLPLTFIEKGLQVSLRDLIEQLNKAQKIKFTFVQNGLLPKWTVQQEIQLYRISTELINNILKHSEATEALVQLECNAYFLELYIKDNGKGMDIAHIKANGGGIGFKNLYARAHELNAEVTLDSDPNGTAISLKIQTS
jgi:two-component system, sensor histidine kinase LadS